jgi:hypothetical protein
MTVAGFDSLRQQLNCLSPLYLWRTPSSQNYTTKGQLWHYLNTTRIRRRGLRSITSMEEVHLRRKEAENKFIKNKSRAKSSIGFEVGGLRALPISPNLSTRS